MSDQIRLLGHDALLMGRDFVVRLIKSGVRPTITGDLWSDNGMGLFGIYAHGITETWKLEKALIGLVACETERHNATNITSKSGRSRPCKLLVSPKKRSCRSIRARGVRGGVVVVWGGGEGAARIPINMLILAC